MQVLNDAHLTSCLRDLVKDNANIPRQCVTAPVPHDCKPTLARVAWTFPVPLQAHCFLCYLLHRKPPLKTVTQLSLSLTAVESACSTSGLSSLLDPHLEEQQLKAGTALLLSWEQSSSSISDVFSLYLPTWHLPSHLQHYIAGLHSVCNLWIIFHRYVCYLNLVV